MPKHWPPTEGYAVLISDLVMVKDRVGWNPRALQGADPLGERDPLFFVQRLCQLARPRPALARRGFHFLIPTVWLAPVMADTETVGL